MNLFKLELNDEKKFPVWDSIDEAVCGADESIWAGKVIWAGDEKWAGDAIWAGASSSNLRVSRASFNAGSIQWCGKKSTLQHLKLSSKSFFSSLY